MKLHGGSKVRNFLLHCIAPVACSVVVGFIFFQEDVFNRYRGAFQFLSSGIVMSVFYYLRMYVRPRDAAIGFLVLLAFVLLTTRSTQPGFILRDILYVAAIGASVELYFRYFRRSPHMNILSPAPILAGLYALSYLVFAELHLGILQSSGLFAPVGNYVTLASTATLFGTLIGGAVGAGIALGEKVFGPPTPGQTQTGG